MVLADYDAKRAIAVGQKLGDADRFPAEQVDANNAAAVIALIKKYTPDLIMNGCDPRFNPVLFDAAFKTGCNYMDMAMSLSEAHPDDPFNKCHIKLGDYQLARHDQWEKNRGGRG